MDKPRQGIYSFVAKIEEGSEDWRIKDLLRGTHEDRDEIIGRSHDEEAVDPEAVIYGFFLLRWGARLYKDAHWGPVEHLNMRDTPQYDK